MMRALVTGGAGFVGSHLVDALVADGHEVTVLDDLSIGRASNLARHGDAVRLVEGTVLDEAMVNELVAGADVVWHLAAVVGVRYIVEQPLHSMRVNAFGTEVVLGACAAHGRKVVVISSSEVNGRTDQLPMHEDDDRVLGPTTVPRWSYATAKALDEHLALAYAQQGLSVVVLRYFNSYGPRMDPRGYGSVVATFLNQALAGEPLTVLGDGTQTRCFTHVKDTARATALAGLESGADGRVVNVGGDDEITMNELAELVLEVTGSASPIVHVDPRECYGPDFQDTLRRRPDSTRARDLLGWEPTKSLRDGLAETVEAWAPMVPESSVHEPSVSESSVAEPFEERARSRELVVGVVGLGYVGLPLAIAYAEAGFRTIGFDVDVERVKWLADGVSHVEDIAGERVGAVVQRGFFEPIADPGPLFTADAVFICVPTPFDTAKTPDLTFVRDAADVVSRTLHAGMLVVLQSTTYPGTTAEVVQPMLERGGLRAGRDFHLAFSPERVDPGNVHWTVSNTPKVVGGTTEECGRRARLLLESVMNEPGLVRVLSSTSAAEMTKLLENTYRAVNIAMVNELAILSREMGIDVWEVIDAASTKPFGFQPFRPGIGPGGHCIPVDPYYLAWRAREYDFQTKFIELAADTNQRMVHYVRGRIADFCNSQSRPLQGARVLMLGASFKPGVGDVRNSRALRLMELIEERGAAVDFSDPYVVEAVVGGRARKSLPLDELTLSDYDLVIICVAHPELPLDDVLDSGVPVFDAVGATVGRPEVPGRIERL